MSQPQTVAPTTLDAVRIRRAELRDSLDRLQHALSAPGRHRPVAWGERVHAAVCALADDFGAHVQVTEGPGGLHRTILAEDVRLTHAVAALTAEHSVLAAEIAALVAGSAAPLAAGDVEGLLERGTVLVAHVVRHQQRGADLVYEALASDLGGCD